MRHLMVLILLAACAMTEIVAQDGGQSEEKGVLIGLHGIISYPRGIFAENFDGGGLGGGFDVGYAPPQLPFAAGFSGNLSWFGSDSKTVRVLLDDGWTDVGMTTTTNMASLNLFARLQPNVGPFRPFAEALGGLYIQWTRSSVDEEDDEIELTGETALNDAVFGYGFGGGIEYCIVAGYEDASGSLSDIYLSVRLRYFFGGEMEYADVSSIEFNQKGEPFIPPGKVMKSNIEVMQILIGISGRL